jgi:hypothetical protein
LERVKCFENEPEWWSRVSFDVHADDAVTVPLPPGIGTVSEYELPGKDTVPCFGSDEPVVGLNTIFHPGVFVLSLAVPDEAKLVQWNVTDVQVAVAVTVCACALAAKMASDRTASTTTMRTRGTIAVPRPRRIAASRDLWVTMLELLRAGVLSLLPVPEVIVTPVTAMSKRRGRAAGSSPKHGEARSVSWRVCPARGLLRPPAPPADSWSRERARSPRFRASARANILVAADVFH